MSPNNSLPAALIFDMDGVLVDSNPFHVQKWIELLEQHRIAFNPDNLPKQILGERNDTALRRFFGPDLSREQSRRLSEALEAKFRRDFRAHAKPLTGLAQLIIEASEARIPMAVASSAMTENVDFIVDALSLRPYFRSLVTGDQVVRPKPDPEIYLKTARLLNTPSSDCVAFEDSFVGVESAKRAGMKCVAVASTFPSEELRTNTAADCVVNSFEEVNLADLRRLFTSRTDRLGS